ncbi:hypothetical protein C8R41DRAFT_927101 [Lentinula lateritia]|uniref:Uncharacterized protein n=1 Tax=Lentinula lateritia TaxID=40482 RepID=A0ABQ8UWS7_9AGAR|nr:hypothetical protein C8R41DRAFT_927101 [Lentinula lateritia]
MSSFPAVLCYVLVSKPDLAQQPIPLNDHGNFRKHIHDTSKCGGKQQQNGGYPSATGTSERILITVVDTAFMSHEVRGQYQNKTNRFGEAQQDESDNLNDRDCIPKAPGSNAHRFFAFRAFASDTLRLPNVLFNAGILSYLLFSTRLLWKVSTMFRSQPHALAIGFVTPGVVMFTLVHRYTSDPVQIRVAAGSMDSAILQIAVDMTILTGAFVCTSIIWLIISVVGELVAALLIVYYFYTTYLV